VMGPELGGFIRKVHEEHGVTFHLGTKPKSIDPQSVTLESGEQLAADLVVIGVGVRPTVDLAEKAGLALDRGVVVNEFLETSAPDVWALGECAGSPQFTHVSEDDFRIVRDNLAGGKRSTRDRLIPYCVFTDPPLARVGLSESEAKRKGVAVRVAKIPTSAVLRAQAICELQGFLKLLVGSDDRILGFTMIGPEAGEVMAVVQTAILAGMPYTQLREAIFAHPTMAEGLGFLIASVPNASVPIRNLQTAA